MRLTRIRLRNYRVYEELDLELPPGLIGVYGANGAGKSSLMESIRFCLWGKARTEKDEIRTSGVNADCAAEVEFEHEGHLYLVRRTISGVNSTVKAETHADGLQVAEGVRDTARYVRSILGMDDAAFRASVFAEQKQIASFSGQTPAERRKLVLQLLGITPVDAAKDQARKDGRMAMEQYTRARDLLPDVEKAKADVADAETVAKAAAEKETAAAKELAQAEEAHTAARKAHDVLVVTRNEYDRIVAEGKATKVEFERAEKRLKELEAEVQGLAEAAEALTKLEPDAAGLAQAEQRLTAVQAVDRARTALAEIPVLEEPARPDEAVFDSARAEAEGAGRQLAEVEGRMKAAADELSRAKEMVHRASALSGEADCPLCGQALGDAFEQVQQHRADELSRAEATTAELTAQQKALAKTVAAAVTEAERQAKALKKTQEVWVAHEKALERRTAAEKALADALRGLEPAPEPDEGRVLAADVDRRRKAQTQCEVLRDRLGRRPEVEAELRTAREHVGELTGTLQTLREKVAALAFKPEQLDAAAKKLEGAEAAMVMARQTAQAAGIKAAESRAIAQQTAKRLADAVEQHAKIADLAEDARHLSKLGELLNVFRNNLVATVGPRLSAQAADLFAELTDHEYDLLEVDPESYEIQIHDAGRVYGMDRFSGSETDLANLALRVAISEHVRFQSGGTVGLLVLDEVFGPLDADRKERMLLALERLKARFRQVLVVTHDTEVKEQLPSAIEVVKLPGRRATARLIGA
ncbi:MAG: SMC family ATPase [Acidimicrobiia bacterium]|nr:SMC family ATPase [Acidimicrobiia bacterium]